MKGPSALAVALLLMAGLAGVALASPSARKLMTGVDAYQNQAWQTAIAAFEDLVGTGIDNGNLFYNLGNAYLKNGDLGRAVLWYERALKHLPDDPDLRFNYNHALSLTKDEKGERTSPLIPILFFWKYQLSPALVRWIAIALNAGLWLVLSILAVRNKQRLRPTTVLIAAATVIFTATAVYNYVEAVRVRYAVILPDQVAVRSGFTDTATQLFVLHAGTKVRVERESDAHLLIRYTADKIGWVNRADAGLI